MTESGQKDTGALDGGVSRKAEVERFFVLTSSMKARIAAGFRKLGGTNRAMPLGKRAGAVICRNWHWRRTLRQARYHGT